VIKYGDKVDMILVMTVEPGFGGQKFMEEMMPKVKLLRLKFPKLNIQVDGGVDTNNVHTCIAHGANVLVSGSSLYKSKDRKATITVMKDAFNKKSS